MLNIENIERLKTIPESLLKAYNVSHLVIDGMRLEKQMIIDKAQREAQEIIKFREFLSEAGLQELQNILEL